MFKARLIQGWEASKFAKTPKLKSATAHGVLVLPLELLGQPIGGIVWTRRILHIWERKGGGWTFNRKQAKSNAALHFLPVQTMLKVLSIGPTAAAVHDPLRHFVITVDRAAAAGLLEA